MLEKRLAEQGSSMKDVEKTTSKQEEIIQNLTKLSEFINAVFLAMIPVVRILHLTS